MESHETLGKTTLESKSITDLKFRLMILAKVIREAQRDKDPRWVEAARQQRIINKVLVEKIKEARYRAGISEPEPVRVGMRPVRLKARRLA